MGSKNLALVFRWRALVGVIALVQWGGAGCRHRAVPRQGHGRAWFVPGLKECFVEGDVMLADSYFCSYFLIADMLRRARGCAV